VTGTGAEEGCVYALRLRSSPPQTGQAVIAGTIEGVWGLVREPDARVFRVGRLAKGLKRRIYRGDGV
jgi:hypothetical protein